MVTKLSSLRADMNTSYGRGYLLCVSLAMSGSSDMTGVFSEHIARNFCNYKFTAYPCRHRAGKTDINRQRGALGAVLVTHAPSTAQIASSYVQWACMTSDENLPSQKHSSMHFLSLFQCRGESSDEIFLCSFHCIQNQAYF